MGMMKTEICPICKKSTNVWQKSGMKKNNIYVCKTCFNKLKSLGVSFDEMKQLDEKKLRQIIHDEVDMRLSRTYDLKTPEGLYQYGFDMGLMTKSRSAALKDLQLIIDIVSKDETIVCSFSGLHNYTSDKGATYYSYALTTNKLIMAKYNVLGSAIQTLPLDHINNITISTMGIKTILKIEALTETIQIGFHSHKIAQKVYKLLSENLNSSPKTNTHTESSADEIKKYKDLLDSGAITLEEYNAKKRNY